MSVDICSCHDSGCSWHLVVDGGQGYCSELPNAQDSSRESYYPMSAEGEDRIICWRETELFAELAHHGQILQRL